MKKAYYAHCIAIYNTPQETRDVVILNNLGLEVINPNSPEHATGYKTEGMNYFQKFADECDCVIFRALPDGRIPAGIAKELEMFRELGKPVIELPSNTTGRTISVEETREYLKEVGYR